MIGRLLPLLALLGAGLPAAAAPPAAEETAVIVVVGVPGAEEYASIFSGEADEWQKIAAEAHASFRTIGRGPAGPLADRDVLQKLLAAEPREGPGKLWLVLIGHGSFDGAQAKFNLRGPDVSAAELASWLAPFHRPLAVIDTSSSSAPFLPVLSGPNRVIVTATRSGDERNYARFGYYLALALADPKSDLDKDGQVSLLEAFLAAAGRTAEFYKTEDRLATEHPLLDDNGDKLGTPADWFEGTRAVKKAEDGASPDGALAAQFVLVPSAEEMKLPPEVRERRDQLELAIARLRERKSSLPEGRYYDQLEALLVPLARIYAPPPSGSSRK